MSLNTRTSSSCDFEHSYGQGTSVDSLHRKCTQQSKFFDATSSHDSFLLFSFPSVTSLDETVALPECQPPSLNATANAERSLADETLNRSFEMEQYENYIFHNNKNSFVDETIWSDGPLSERSNASVDVFQRSPSSSPASHSHVCDDIAGAMPLLLDETIPLQESAVRQQSLGGNLVKAHIESICEYNASESEVKNVGDSCGRGHMWGSAHNSSVGLFERLNQQLTSQNVTIKGNDVVRCSPALPQLMHENSPCCSSVLVKAKAKALTSFTSLVSNKLKSSVPAKDSHVPPEQTRKGCRGMLDGWVLKGRKSVSASSSHRHHKPYLIKMDEVEKGGLLHISSKASADETKLQICQRSQSPLSSRNPSKNELTFLPNNVSFSELVFMRPVNASSPLNRKSSSVKTTPECVRSIHHVLSPINGLSSDVLSPLSDTPPPSVSKVSIRKKLERGSQKENPSRRLFPLFRRGAGSLRGHPEMTQHSGEVARMFSSPNFIRQYEEVKSSDVAHLQLGEVIRKKEDRKLLHGFDCKCCADYYDALGLSSQQKRDRIDEVSRHRAIVANPTTPEHYWEVRMADRGEQKRRGQIAESESPLVLKTRYTHYRPHNYIKRQLFN